MRASTLDGDITSEVTRHHFRWLGGLLIATLILNVVDALLTLVWIESGTAVEANPLLAQLAHEQPLTFVAVKMALVSLGAWLLWRLRRRSAAVVAIFVCFLAYYLLLLHHLRGVDLEVIGALLARAR